MNAGNICSLVLDTRWGWGGDPQEQESRNGYDAAFTVSFRHKLATCEMAKAADSAC